MTNVNITTAYGIDDQMRAIRNKRIAADVTFVPMGSGGLFISGTRYVSPAVTFSVPAT